MSFDRLLDDLRALVRSFLPSLTFLGVYEYLVQSSSSATVSATPTDPSIGLPSIPALSLSPSILGESVIGAAVGATCLVEFVNGDQTRPTVISLSLPSTNTTIDATGTLEIGPSAAAVELAGGTAPIARQGDIVAVYLPTTPPLVTGAVYTAGPTPVPIGNFTGTIAFAGPATGIIVTGNPRATA